MSEISIREYSDGKMVIDVDGMKYNVEGLDCCYMDCDNEETATRVPNRIQTFRCVKEGK